MYKKVIVYFLKKGLEASVVSQKLVRHFQVYMIYVPKCASKDSR